MRVVLLALAGLALLLATAAPAAADLPCQDCAEGPKGLAEDIAGEFVGAAEKSRGATEEFLATAGSHTLATAADAQAIALGQAGAASAWAGDRGAAVEAFGDGVAAFATTWAAWYEDWARAAAEGAEAEATAWGEDLADACLGGGAPGAEGPLPAPAGPAASCPPWLAEAAADALTDLTQFPCACDI